MNKFIEVTVKGQRVLVNLDHVEDIRDSDGECVIYYAFTCPDAIDQDYIKPDQSYDEVMLMIQRQAYKTGNDYQQSICKHELGDLIYRSHNGDCMAFTHFVQNNKHKTMELQYCIKCGAVFVKDIGVKNGTDRSKTGCTKNSRDL